MMWININCWFRNKRLNQLEFVWLRCSMAQLMIKVNPSNKFYLFEDKPHLFIAMQIPCKTKMLEYALKDFKKSTKRYLSKVVVKYNTPDDKNGKTFIEIMNSLTDFNLFHIQTSKDGWKRRSRWNYLLHIVHCMLNEYLGDEDLEREFYRKLAKTYEV